ncbi:MAG: sugar ABC transporter substrate-binding protein [Firmicutes bacterium]|nr:sugar ABC transporter substrate-binding protein [Bacillota bacterium]
MKRITVALLCLALVMSLSMGVLAAKKPTLNILVRSSDLWNKVEDLSADFTAKTGIEVKFTKLPESQLYDRIALVGATGNNPFDITATGHFGAAQYGMAGYFAELPIPEDAEDFIPSTIDQWKVGDKLYGWPVITDTNLYFYRQDLFDKYGIAGPAQTWDEFRDIARKLTIDKNGNSSTDPNFDPNNVEVWGAIFKGAQNNASTGEWCNWLLQNGGEVLDEDFNVIVNEKPSVDSLQYLADLLHKDKVMPQSITGFGYTEFHTFFVQGKAAQAINWLYMYDMSNDPEASKVVGKVGIAPMPQGVRKSGMMGGWSWNVFEDSKNKEAALEFIKYMTSPEVGWELALLGNPPVRTSVFQQLIDEKGHPWPIVLDQLQYGEAQNHLATGQTTAIERDLQLAIQKVLLGEETAQEVLDESAKNIEAILTKSGVK